jgi:regulator of sirC expression with transglutaminase-like and TPR domain
LTDMPDYQPIDYRLRCHTKRTDLPSDVLRDIGEAYAEIERLRSELEDTKIELANMEDDYFRIRRDNE